MTEQSLHCRHIPLHVCDARVKPQIPHNFKPIRRALRRENQRGMVFYDALPRVRTLITPDMVESAPAIWGEMS